MARVVVVGDGPAGLSAALFLARGGHDVTVFGQDATAMHYAHLHNYLGIPEIGGTEFQEVARAQVERHGATLLASEVTAIEVRDGAFAVRAGDDGSNPSLAEYVVLAGGKQAQRLAAALGAERSEGEIPVDTEYRTGVDRVYAVGRVARPNRSQAIISAGAGATAALDIIAREAGKDVVDWDSPPED